MTATTTTLGSFIVNLGSIAELPFGQRRVFQVGGQCIAVTRIRECGVLAIDPHVQSKAYPASVNERGDILVGVEALWASARRSS